MHDNQQTSRIAELTLRLAAVEERLRRAEDELALMRVQLEVTGCLIVRNESGTHGFELSADETCAQFAVIDENGRCPIVITHDKSGGRLKFCDPLGQKRIEIGLTHLDSPVVALLSEDSNARVLLHLTGDGPTIELRDNDENLRLQVVQTKQGVGIGLFNPDGSLVWSMPPSKGLDR